MYRKIYTASMFLVLILLSGNFKLLARPEGITGITLKSVTTGCGTCHSSHGDPNNLVKVVISGPDTLKVGETATYKVKITGGTGQNVGTDIACSNGKLINADNNLKLLNSELTHTAAKLFSNGGYTFTFKYTAPSTPGVQTLYADGLSSKPQWNFAQNFSIQVVNIATDVNSNNITPENYSLSQNYPNPFNPASKITYYLPKESYVKLIIYNLLGEVVQELVNGMKPKGSHEAIFDGSNFSSGIYFYSIETKSLDGKENFKMVKKMSLIK